MIGLEQLKSTHWRYERKFVLEGHYRAHVESMIKLHPATFSEIFHERCVNNIYFDSMNMDNYLENELGASQRVKTRIRWYGDLFGVIQEPILELKTKNGIVGSKTSFPLSPFTLDSNFCSSSLKTGIKASKIPALIKEELLLMQPTLLNHYSRKYFHRRSAGRSPSHRGSDLWRGVGWFPLAFYPLYTHGSGTARDGTG